MIPEKTEGLERLFRINADVIRAIQFLIVELLANIEALWSSYSYRIKEEKPYWNLRTMQ